MEFFRFPHTPHIAWLGRSRPRDDKVLSPSEVSQILAEDVIVEEKVDGANVGFSVDEAGRLRVQNRGTFINRGHGQPQFKPLFGWLTQYEEALVDALSPDLTLFGEWTFAVHSVRYSRLPDWFLAFDVYDRKRRLFWNTPRRNRLAKGLSLEVVPQIAAGRFDLSGIKGLLSSSRLSDGPAEGLYIRKDEGDWLRARAKLVRPEFIQEMSEHWSQRELRTNSLVRSNKSSY